MKRKGQPSASGSGAVGRRRRRPSVAERQLQLMRTSPVRDPRARQVLTDPPGEDDRIELERQRGGDPEC